VLVIVAGGGGGVPTNVLNRACCCPRALHSKFEDFSAKFNNTAGNYSHVETCHNTDGTDSYSRSVWVLGGSVDLANTSALRRYVFADGTHSKITFWITRSGQLSTVSLYCTYLHTSWVHAFGSQLLGAHF
jgi:hypothetical protein